MCMCAALWLYTLPQRVYIRIRYSPALISPACPATILFALLFTHLADVSRRDCVAASAWRIIDACEAIGTDSASYRTTGAVLPFLVDRVPANVSPSLAGFKHSWEGFLASPVRVDDAQRVMSVATFVSRLVLCSRFRHC